MPLPPSEQVEWKQVDFLDLKGVDATTKCLASIPRLDCIWSNAVIGTGPRRLSPDGLDSHFTLNHLAHYILMNNLLSVVRNIAKEQGEAMVVFTTSSLHSSACSTNKFNSKERINEDLGPNGLFGRTKLANLLYARQLVRLVADVNVYIHTIHPGAVKTGISREIVLTSDQKLSD